MDREERRERKAHLVAGMLEGCKWRDAGIRTSRTAAYRLLRLVRTEGDAPLEERRHGHPYKLTGTVRGWLVERYRGTPGVPARVPRTETSDRFGVTVSLTHINRVRAGLGVGNTSRVRGEDQRPPDETEWHEGAGSLLLLAAAHQTGLIDALEVALPEDLPADNGRRYHSDSSCRRSLLLTLLFLPAVGLKCTHDLRGYTGDALALLTGRQGAYSYSHVERFLSAAARPGGAEPLTDALAGWTAKLWQAGPRPAEEPIPGLLCGRPPQGGSLGPAHTPRTGVEVRQGAGMQGADALARRAGASAARYHTPGRHAPHHGLPQHVARYERAVGNDRVRRVIADREGMAAEFLVGLVGDGRDVITILRSNQYEGYDPTEPWSWC